MRNVTSVSDALFLSVLATIFLLLHLHFAQILFKAVEALLPEPPVAIDPISDVFQRCGIELTRTPLRIAPLGDETGPLQHFEMLGYSRQTHVERRGQLRDRGLPGGQSRQNRPPG